MAERRKKTVQKIIGLFLVAVVILIASAPITMLFKTQSKMRKFKTAVSIGTGTNEIIGTFGKPTKVVPAGAPVPGPRNRFTMSVVPTNQVLYFYAGEGIPYYQVFYLIENDTGKLTDAVVDNLWW